ncbi:MAG: CopG family antitoxin [Candidatus Berkelbacteria bacterium]|nr:CopG family antitoxin [Candidatus Berkelbacteria bacterium]MCR4306935.1 CopG family antitoxin [Candidatus Berkelbacteria bacterium]
MKYYELDKEEEQIAKDFEAGELVRVGNFAKHKKALLQAARVTLNKTKNINIRLSERVLQKLKVRAQREGIPYQTLAASILHRDTNQQN